VTIYRDDLERVRALIEDPRRWTKGHDARDANGERCDAVNVRATCWCIVGAAIHVGAVSFRRYGKSRGFYDLAQSLGVSGLLSNFNDSHTHAEVLALLTRAIERAPVRDGVAS
jgi:hypothetical protein